MKDFYTLVDYDGFPVKMYVEKNLLHVKKVSINNCDEYTRIESAENGVRILHEHLNKNELLIMSGKHPFRVGRVVTIRHLIEV